MAEAIPLCNRCGLAKVLVAHVPQGSFCQDCFRWLFAEGYPCSNCGVLGDWSLKHPQDESKGPVCKSCCKSLKPIIGQCARCPRIVRLHNMLQGKAVCPICYTAHFPKGKCPHCGKTRPLTSLHPHDDPAKCIPRRICRSSFVYLVYGLAPCPICKEPRRLRVKHPDCKVTRRTGTIIRICTPCHFKLTKTGLCVNCNKEKPLVHVHPADRDKATNERRHVCRACHWKLTPAKPKAEKEQCPNCEKMGVLLRKVVAGLHVRICKNCWNAHRFRGVCSICNGEKVLRRVHPKDRALPKSRQRRICIGCHRRTLKGVCAECKYDKPICFMHPQDGVLPPEERRHVCYACHTQLTAAAENTS